MLVEDIVNGAKGKLINGDLKRDINNFIIDNREENNGAFFIPIVGEKVDAHKFITASVKNGLAGFFINESLEGKEEIEKVSLEENKDIVIIEVSDTLKALYELAVYNRRKHLNIPVIGVTGSVGKTSTRQMINSVVSQEKNTLVTEKNYNGYIGLSLMALKIKNQDICVFEAGIDRFGEMAELSEILLPDIAVMTMIGTSHIEKLKSQENIFKEKFDITRTLRGINTLVVNADDKYLSTIKDNGKFNLEKYSISDVSDVSISIDGISFYTNIYGSKEKVNIYALGEHNILNALAAIRVGELLKISKENILKGIAEYRNFSRRLEIKKLGNGVTIIDDAYNASVDSVKSGLKSINKIKGNKIAVLGDMLELGEHSERLHQEVGEAFKDLEYSKVLTMR